MVHDHIEKKFDGCLDIQKAPHASDLYMQTWTEDTQPFKDMMLSIMRRLETLDPDWAHKRPCWVTTVPPAPMDGAPPVGFRVAPWQLGA